LRIAPTFTTKGGEHQDRPAHPDVETYLALALAAFGAGTMLPLVSEGVLAGFLLAGDEPPWALWTVATAANSLGSAFNWGVGRYCLHWQDRRWFPLTRERLATASKSFSRYGTPSLLFAWVPLIGDPLTFAAGVLRVRFDLFILLVAVGKGGRYAAILAGVDALAAVG
jgi:membrane protein YqaA with SNARE-associated domain